MCLNPKGLILSWYSCRAIFLNLWGIISCRVFLSSLDGVTHPCRTLLCNTKWLCSHRYCFRVCGYCEYSLHPFRFLLLIRYLIYPYHRVFTLGYNPIFQQHGPSDLHIAGIYLYEGGNQCHIWTEFPGHFNLCWSWSSHRVWDNAPMSTFAYPDLQVMVKS